MALVGMEYIVPGLIGAMSVITNSYSNVASSFFSAKFQKNIEELLVAPGAELCDYCWFRDGGGAAYWSVLSTFVSLFFVDLQVDHWGVIIATVFLTSVFYVRWSY